jgi:hypothetical protein
MFFSSRRVDLQNNDIAYHGRDEVWPLPTFESLGMEEARISVAPTNALSKTRSFAGVCQKTSGLGF